MTFFAVSFKTDISYVFDSSWLLASCCPRFSLPSENWDKGLDPKKYPMIASIKTPQIAQMRSHLSEYPIRAIKTNNVLFQTVNETSFLIKIIKNIIANKQFLM